MFRFFGFFFQYCACVFWWVWNFFFVFRFFALFVIYFHFLLFALIFDYEIGKASAQKWFIFFFWCSISCSPYLRLIFHFVFLSLLLDAHSTNQIHENGNCLFAWNTIWHVYHTKSIIQTKDRSVKWNKRIKKHRSISRLPSLHTNIEKNELLHVCECVSAIEMKIISIYLIWFITYKMHETHADCREYICVCVWSDVGKPKTSVIFVEYACAIRQFNDSRGKNVPSYIYFFSHDKPALCTHTHTHQQYDNQWWWWWKRERKLNPFCYIYISYACRIK